MKVMKYPEENFRDFNFEQKGFLSATPLQSLVLKTGFNKWPPCMQRHQRNLHTLAAGEIITCIVV
jgi:hypothetical protein